MITKEEFSLENFIATAMRLDGHSSTLLKSTYKSRVILSITQFTRLVSIFDDEKGFNRREIEEKMSNFSEGTDALGWDHPLNIRRLESCIEDEVWNIAGRYIDYVSPFRSIGWDARTYLGNIDG